MADEAAQSKLALSPKTREHFGLHYLGISLILAWYYCLWFTPSIFVSASITDDTVTFAWLATLSFTGIAFLATPFALKKIRLYEHPIVAPAAAGAMGAATLVFSATPFALSVPLLAFLTFPIIFGIGNALLWVAWGEFHARRKSAFSLHKFVFVFGAVMLTSISICTLLPHLATDVLVALLPLASGLIYRIENKELGKAEPPTLLPKATRAKTSKATAFISIAVFIACMACYYNIAIIPIDDLFAEGLSYVAGIMGAAAVCLIIAGVQKASKKKQIASYRVLPWFIVACSVSLALFANGDHALYNLSFIISVTLAGVFEVFLIAYFGALSVKGHLSPVLAFAISSGVVRLGFFAGDSLAVAYEHSPFLADHLTQATSLCFLCLMTTMLILLLRQESAILRLTQAPAATSEIEEVCDAAIQEFSLSKREGEILKYIARGYTIDNISKKLVISPYTTQTHVRHIYSKMHVHKRSELLDYINMHRSESA